jgi:hypothetical protein
LDARAVQTDAMAAATMTRTPGARTTHVGLYVSAVVVAFFVVRVLGAPWPSGFPAAWSDATDPQRGFLSIADRGPFNADFYDAYQAVGYPLFLWLFGRSVHLAVIAQTIAYVCAFTALCLTARHVLRERVVGSVAIVAFVAIAFQAKYAMWTTQILSEGLAIALGLIAVVAWWRYADDPTPARLSWAYGFVIAWLLIDDTFLLPTLLVLGPISVVLFVRATTPQTRRVVGAGAVALIASVVYVFMAQQSSDRGTVSFHSVIGLRVLPDEELTELFVDWGMPLDDALRTREGKAAFDDDFLSNTDPAFDAYREWAESDGRRALLVSALKLDPAWREGFSENLPFALEGNYQRFDTHDVYDRLPDEIPRQLGGPDTPRGLAVWSALGVVALAIVLAVGWRGRGRRLAAFVVAIAAQAWIELYLVWVGDPVDFDRHAVGALLRLTIVTFIVLATAADLVVERRKLRRFLEPAAEPAVGPDVERDGELAGAGAEADS